MTDIRPIHDTEAILREADERKSDTQLAPLPVQAIKPIETDAMEYIFTYKLPLTNYLLAILYIQIIGLFVGLYIIRLALGRGLGSFPSLDPIMLEPSSSASGYIVVVVSSFLVLTLLTRISLFRYVAIIAAVGCIGYLVYSAGLIFAALSPYGIQSIQNMVFVYSHFVILITLLGITVIYLLRRKIAQVYRQQKGVPVLPKAV